jgi:putative endonuclease
MLAEQEAALFLIHKGHIILQRNWRFKALEIDIISQTGPYIVFTEVKRITRFSPKALTEKINSGKQTRLMRAAAEYMRIFVTADMEYRFDVICYSKNANPIHIEAAFYPNL